MAAVEATVGDNMAEIDLDIARMKYMLWKPKMTCGSCMNGNDVEIFLPCGHVLCK